MSETLLKFFKFNALPVSPARNHRRSILRHISEIIRCEISVSKASLYALAATTTTVPAWNMPASERLVHRVFRR